MRMWSLPILVTGLSIAGSGCAPAVVITPREPIIAQAKLVPIGQWSTTLLTARSVPALGDVREISDHFTFEGRVFAHATLTSAPGSSGGRPALEMRWYNGDKLVSVKKMEANITASPYYVFASTSGTAIGAGNAHVDLLADGKLMASKAFLVSEK